MACGSPSSRLARQPMWPLDRAKMDSDLPSCARTTLVSRTTHGSGLERSGFRINSRIPELGKVLHDDIRSVRTHRIGLPGAVDADTQPNAPRPPGPAAAALTRGRGGV